MAPWEGKLKTYFTVWWLIATNAWQVAFVNRGTNLLFIIGKATRITMTLAFLFIIRAHTTSFAGYNSDQLVVFFLSYNLIDTLAQIFFRGVYLFGNLIKTGEFDFLLSKPIDPLFRALTQQPDINDLLFFLPNILITIYIIHSLSITVTLGSLLLYLLLFANGLLIATALHILVLVIGIRTVEVDGVIWLYRDVSALSRFPVSMYSEPLRFALFFLIPVGMMVTIPTEILLGIAPTHQLLTTLLMGPLTLFVSVKLWQHGLKAYSSAGG